MDYAGRIKKVCEEMRKRGIALMYLRRGANLWYLAGIQRGDPELTDHNTYGDYIQGAYIGVDGDFVLVGPRMGASSWQKQADGKPWIKEVRIIYESEKPREVLREILHQFNLNGGICLEERAWAYTALLFRELLPNCRIFNASEILNPMRMIKDEEEIALMKKAGEITDKVYGEVVETLKIGLSELDVAFEIDYRLRHYGAEQSSFSTGVRFRSPKNPWKLWERNNSKTRLLEEGDTITFDFGCVYKGYCSDFGRTVYVGKPPEKVKLIHALVVEAQSAAIERMIDEEITAEQLDGVSRSIIEQAGYGSNFVHRLGHGIGVTVHEPPYLYPPDNTVLKEMMTFTIEPSIMLFGEWSVRIEDVVMVTKKGGVPLNNYHKELTII